MRSSSPDLPAAVLDRPLAQELVLLLVCDDTHRLAPEAAALDEVLAAASLLDAVLRGAPLPRPETARALIVSHSRGRVRANVRRLCERGDLRAASPDVLRVPGVRVVARRHRDHRRARLAAAVAAPEAPSARSAALLALLAAAGAAGRVLGAEGAARAHALMTGAERAAGDQDGAVARIAGAAAKAPLAAAA